MNKTNIIELRVKRFFALLIDWYLTNLLVAMPITLYLRKGEYLQPDMFDYSSYPLHVGLLLILFGIFIGIFYFILIPLYVFDGQTLGKKLCKIKITTTDHSPLRLSTMIKRELIGATLLEGGLILIAIQARKLFLILGYSTLFTQLKYLSFILTIASIIYAYFNPLTQTFHDKLANTMIVKK